IEVRIPLSERDAMMEFLHNLGIRVLNESTSANDIKDQYEDLDAKLATLTKTKDRFEELYDQAETVEEILKVQSQLLNLQRQIDKLTGRIKELEGKTDTTLISVSLTTDELALGYTPGDPWAPQNTLKLATRSLNMTFRDIGDFAIWAGVYALIWLPLLGAGIVLVKMLNNKSKDKSKK
ncbi:MAG: DUF4349 domain-containing protein, partial [Romboutsia sp.]|nr:DUF4349 domain-containing protein [Romboutsia sp.]